MSHLPNGRQSTPHLRLCPDEVKELWERGCYSPKGYLYHLILAHRKPGWPWRIENISEFCRTWGIARSTFYKAKAALIAEGLITEEIFGAIELKISSTNDCLPPETGVSNPGLDVSDLKHLSLIRDWLSLMGDRYSLKPLTYKASVTLHL